MTIRELVTKWGFKVDEKPLSNVESKLEAIKGKLNFLATVEIAKGLMHLSEKFSTFAQDIQVASENAGMTVESYQKLAKAAAMSGVSQEELGGSLARLSRRLWEAKNGSEDAIKSFSQAGITPAQIHSIKNGSEALGLLSDNFKNMNDPIKKNALSMELLGKSGYQMISFMSKGSSAIKQMGDETDRLGTVLSQDQVKALLEVEHSFSKLWSVMKGFAAEIAAFVAPEVNAAIKELLGFWEVNRKVITLRVKEWLSDFAYALGFLWGIVKIVAQSILDFASKHETLTKWIMHTVFAIASLTTALLIGLKIFSIFKNAFETAKEIRSFIKDIGEMTETVKKWGIWTRIMTAAQSAWNVVLGVFSGEIAIISLPVLGLVAAIGALIVVGQALWTVFTGGDFKDTWIGQAWEMLKSGGSKLLGMLGFGGEEENAGTSGGEKMFGGIKNLMNVPGIVGVPPSITSPTGATGASNNEYSISAPIKIDVPAGTDPKMVGDKAQAGVKEHLDSVMRQAQRSLRPATSY